MLGIAQGIAQGPNPGLLRPPAIFLCAVLVGVVLNWAWPLKFMPRILIDWTPCYGLRRSARSAFLPGISGSRHFGPGKHEFHNDCADWPYRFSRNPIYLAFILFVLGLSVWLNNLWMLVTLIPAVGIVAMVVIPREERFLERNFNDQYSSYKSRVRRWL